MKETSMDRSAAPSAAASSDKPVTAKDRVAALVVGAALLGFCVAVWMWPDLVAIDTSEVGGRRGRLIAVLLTWVWWKPVATIAGLLGALMLFAALKGSSGKQASAASGS